MTRVVLTAPRGSFAPLSHRLRAAGLVPVHRPLLDFVPPPSWEAFDAALAGAAGFGAVVLTSPRAARAFIERVHAAAPGVRAALGVLPVWVVGAGTARPLGALAPVARRPDPAAARRLGSGRALADAMLAAGVEGPVLFPCGDNRRDELPGRLAGAGIAVHELVCYQTRVAGPSDVLAALDEGELLVVTSPSVAARVADAAARRAEPVRLVAVGPTTAAAAPQFVAAVAERPTVAGLVAAVHRALAQPDPSLAS